MTITAKFQGRCGHCGGPIAVGSQINWTKGAKSTHLTCPAPAATAMPASTRPRLLMAGTVRAGRAAQFMGRGGKCRNVGCGGQATDRGYCRDCAFDEFDGA